MSNYAWIITHVNTKELGDEMADEVGVAGPRGATPEMIEKAKKDGATFRMLDDDGIWYYRGKLYFEGMVEPAATDYGNDDWVCTGMGGDDEIEFAPLNRFGMPNAGCTTIEYRCTQTTDPRFGSKVWAVL